MSREVALLLAVGVALALIVAMWWGWRRRGRRDAALAAPTIVPSDAVSVLRTDGLYVATSRAGDPLDRLAIRGFAVRSRATVDVTDRGVAIALTGQPTVFLPADRIRSTGRATWTIDRVVESGGLVVITWALTDQIEADTVLRLPEGDDERFLAATAPLLSAPNLSPASIPPSASTPHGDAA